MAPCVRSNGLWLSTSQTILDQQVEVALRERFGPTQTTFVKRSDLATPVYVQLAGLAASR